jgi:hypothetical protein
MDVAEKISNPCAGGALRDCDTHAVAGRRYHATKAHWSENALSAEADAKGVRRPVMRLLLSAECVHNCPYCPLRAGSDVPRATFTPTKQRQPWRRNCNAIMQDYCCPRLWLVRQMNRARRWLIVRISCGVAMPTVGIRHSQIAAGCVACGGGCGRV